jgi:2-succinyl-5-enolpyruvyl-6-hydroxy-3-cyclohexene-1-carboxylate synthase
LLEFQTILTETSQQPRFQIIEVKGEPKDPVDTWQALQQQFSEAGAQQ